MSTASFLLLRLPYVALREVLWNAGPREIFLLSTCSRRSFRIVKSIKRPSPKWEIFFNWLGTELAVENDDGIDYLLEVRVYDTTDAPKDLEVINIGSYKVYLRDMGGISLDTYWDDVITGMKEMANYFTEIFHRSIDHLNLFETDPKWRIDWVNTRQKSVKSLYYDTRQPTVEDISYVFSNLKVENSMCAIFHFPDKLARPEIKIAPMSLNFLEIGLASWMTLEHILAFDCEYSYFSHTNLSSQDLNALLKHWVNGGFSRLGELFVSTNEVFNYDIVLEGMEFEDISLDVVRQYPVYKDVRQTRGGFDVTRGLDRSMVTLLKEGDRSFTLVLTSRMQVPLAVENDDDDGIDYLLGVRVYDTTDAPKDLEVIHIGSYKVFLRDMGGISLDTYWDDKTTGMKEMANYFTEIFHCPIDHLGLYEADPKWRVDWINSRQKSVKELYYETREPNVEDISYVFSNLKVDNWLCAIFHFPDKLVRPEIEIAPMSLRSLDINYASWMTVKHILAFDCEYSDFRRTNLSSQDLNYLLKHWVNGGFSRLGELCLYTNEVFNYEIVLEEVEFEEISLDVVRQYPVDRGVRQTRGGFDVRRELDGSTVTLLKKENQYFTLVLTSRMQAL